MKKLLIVLTLIITNQYLSAEEIDMNRCDSIEKKSKKIVCLNTLKQDLLVNKSKKKIKAVNKKIKNLNSKKKEFDKKNKTLMDVWKNYTK